MTKPSTIKRSVVLAGHATRVSFEREFWEALHDIARADAVSLASLIARTDADLGRRQNLFSAIRVYILKRFACGKQGVKARPPTLPIARTILKGLPSLGGGV